MNLVKKQTRLNGLILHGAKLFYCVIIAHASTADLSIVFVHTVQINYR